MQTSPGASDLRCTHCGAPASPLTCTCRGCRDVAVGCACAAAIDALLARQGLCDGCAAHGCAAGLGDFVRCGRLGDAAR